MRTMKSMMMAAALASAAFVASAALADDIPAAPAKGVSPRVDAIRASGVLRVGVQPIDPWLTQNTTGTGEPWSGPAWMLAKKYADLLGVKLQEVPTSNDTKVTLLGANQADISISAMGVSPERLQVVDFVVYSHNSTCMIYKKSNPKFKNVKTLEDLNSPEFDIVFGIGSHDEPYQRERFPKAKIRGVTNIVDEVVSGHADTTSYNRLEAGRMLRKMPEMAALPAENNCQGSTEQSSDMGMAVAKGQTAFIDWLRAVQTAIQADLTAEEMRSAAKMN
jgi:polar amino acid transport system substrate-binding protein